MKLCIRGHDLGKKGEFNLAESLLKFGFDGVQLVPYKAYAEVDYSPKIDFETAQKLSQELKEANLSVHLIGAYFNPVHSDKAKVENGIATFKRYLELAKTFNTTLVGSETGSFNDDKWTYNPKNRTDEAMKTVVETFSSLCKKAEEEGVFVGIEGAAGHVLWSVDRLKQAVDLISSKRLKVIFDLYNYLDDLNYGDYLSILSRGLELFSGNIHCFHMKDCRIEDGKLKQCAIGKGIFDYPKIIKTIKNYDKNAVLVLEGTTGENIAPSIKLIKELWQSV